MGFFDDLINNQADDYIDVFIYIEELSNKYKSNPRSVIAYLLGVGIENLYFQDSTGAYYKSEEPDAVKNALKELIFNLDQRIARAVRASNAPEEAINETAIFEEMWDSTQYGSFKRSELPKTPNDHSIKHPTEPPRQITSGIAKVGSLVTVQERETAAIPNKFQNMAMLNDYFTPHQASCLMAGLHPNFNGSDDDLEIARTVIDGGIKSGKLILDDDGQIKSENLKKFLSGKSWLLLGFNDYVTSKGSMSLGVMLKNKDNESLQIELDKAQAEVKKLKAENAKLKEQLEQHASQPQNYNIEISDRTERGYLITIGLLLELMTTPKGVNNKAPFQSQSTIIADIVDKKIYEQGKSTLETRFSEANRTLENSKKQR